MDWCDDGVWAGREKFIVKKLFLVWRGCWLVGGKEV